MSEENSQQPQEEPKRLEAPDAITKINGEPFYIMAPIMIQRRGTSLTFVQAHMHCHTGERIWVEVPVLDMEPPKLGLILPNGKGSRLL